MLTKPYAGCTEFQIEGTSWYTLSYLTNIAIEWMDAVIRGLNELKPFCVRGYMEPGRFLCIVSYWNCYIICENETRYSCQKNTMEIEVSNVNMMEFCQMLYNDISQNIVEWTTFCVGKKDFIKYKKFKKRILEQLQQLKKLIEEKGERFEYDGFFN